MISNAEKIELRELLDKYLKHGDKTEVASTLTVSPQIVSMVLKEFDLESPIMDALIAKAEANKAASLSKTKHNVNKIKNLGT
ncbi:hypothetical protein [Pontibacter sp. SGAir0037]|uniref:hypothetical protein n=1 Tax=Pontibacter sp. SGAir0037 TaxID=2571030 RepID=UPI0010CCD2BA|nr:hypothetical protein [Pontibacter sp. SGAir0037]QCR23106.1 hypothetical protein C1N53_12610 [Pontibacter sp. SGAir0037]